MGQAVTASTFKVGYKPKLKKGLGTVTLKKTLAKGKHTLVFRLKGQGKVGFGDLTKTVKINR